MILRWKVKELNIEHRTFNIQHRMEGNETKIRKEKKKEKIIATESTEDTEKLRFNSH